MAVVAVGSGANNDGVFTRERVCERERERVLVCTCVMLLGEGAAEDGKNPSSC